MNEPSGEKRDEERRDEVKKFYGETIKSCDDFKTYVCSMTASDVPSHVKQAINNVHDDVRARDYGCGMVIPVCLQSARVLDLGCGAGKDCYVLSQLVGRNGFVTGLDMTKQQLDLARKYLAYHTEKFSLEKPNVEFKEGYIEKMADIGIQDQFYDVIVSNCVVSLCTDKGEVFKETFRVLKEGGEFFFSDVYADGAVSEEVKKNATLWGEGISGALSWPDFYRIAQDAGFSSPRLVLSRPYHLQDPELLKLVGDVKFIAGTYRIFRLPQSLEESCYATYRGGILSQEDCFVLDVETSFKKGQQMAIDSSVASILKSSRFREHFDFEPIGKDPRVDPFLYTEK